MFPKRRGPPPAPKPTVYDGMSDEAFLAHLEELASIDGSQSAAIERRVNRAQGVFYERASRLFMSKSNTRNAKATDTSF